MSEQLRREYQIGAEIGRGKFGVVHRCTSAVTGEPYALKSVDKSAISDALDREALDREAKLTGLVSGHPNIVTLHAVYEDDSYLHLVLGLCHGPDLYDRIVASAPMPEAEAAVLMRPLMEAIAHCHRHGVAHRDVKPDNVMFDGRGRPVLADFGSAGWFGDGRPMEGLFGTPYYVAPEVVAGRPYGEKVDVWSAGVILYVMLSGMPPFYGDSAVEIFEAVLRKGLRFPMTVFRDVSPLAKDLIRRMLSRDVSRRLSASKFSDTRGWREGTRRWRTPRGLTPESVGRAWEEMPTVLILVFAHADAHRF